MPRSVNTWMADRLWVGKPSRYANSHLGQLSGAFHPSGVGKSSTALHWLGLRRGVFACVGWQAGDPIWQATPRSSEIDCHEELIIALTFYFLNLTVLSTERVGM